MSNSASTAPSADGPTATKTKGKRQRKAKAEQAAAKRTTVAALPSPSDLRLAPNGVYASKKNRYVNLKFADDFEVRLYPVGYKPTEVAKVRDLMVTWLNKRLGG